MQPTPDALAEGLRKRFDDHALAEGFDEQTVALERALSEMHRSLRQAVRAYRTTHPHREKYLEQALFAAVKWLDAEEGLERRSSQTKLSAP
jgi:hypothetical protein